MHTELEVTALFIFAPAPQSVLAEDEGVIFENEHAILQRVVVPADELEGHVGEGAADC
jgi:hypothetical protein